MNSRVGRLGGHSHDSRNLTFLFRSREATTHRVYLNEVDTPLARFWALPFSPDSHFSFDSANHRVASDAFIYAGWKALKALRRSTPNG